MAVVELLTAHLGENAARYGPYFRYSKEARISGVEIRAVGTESTTVRYSGQEETYKEVNNILRIKTADGFEGVSGVDTYHAGKFSDSHLRELQDIAAEFMALQTLDPAEVVEALVRSRTGLSDAVLASIDIALWDLAARKANLPLSHLLGAQRQSIEAYASLPFYESLPEYAGAVHRYAKLGFSMFKFHVWGSVDDDLRLVASLRKAFSGSGFRFMIDLECKYDRDDALRLGEEMDEELFVWLEAPIDDAELLQYAELRDRLTVPIIPDGNSFYSPEFIANGIAAGSWDAGRIDTTVVGGVSNALALLMLANDAGLSIEIQSWGHSLAQAANLHVALGNARTRYFEAPMPTAAFDFGMGHGISLSEGRVVAPGRPGLGIEVDWEQLEAADFYAYANCECILAG